MVGEMGQLVAQDRIDRARVVRVVAMRGLLHFGKEPIGEDEAMLPPRAEGERRAKLAVCHQKFG